MASGDLHLLKLSVGTETVGDLADWQAGVAERYQDGQPRHVTRMWPKRADALLDGGSIYWVIKGVILARQALAGFEPVDRGDGIVRCGMVLDRTLVPVRAVPRSPFQGWRYLAAGDAPRDRGAPDGAEDLPPRLEAALAEFGIL